MEAPESETQSFVIKLWLEEVDHETGETILRGHITHVPGGERRYLKDLEEIGSFIKGYLDLNRTDRVRTRIWQWRYWFKDRKNLT